MEGRKDYSSVDTTTNSNTNTKNEVEMNWIVPTATSTHDRSSSKKSISSRKRQPQMLTSGQLSDLFRRLDTSGDGELDFEEFQNITRKLKFTTLPEGFVADVFNQYDTQKSGTLSLQEFQAAYTKVFAHANLLDSAKFGVESQKTGKKDEFVIATRYGVDANGKSIYEVYSGVYPKITDVLKIPIINKDVSFEVNMESAVLESFDGTVETLNRMVKEDGLTNSAKKCKVFWWIDISIDELRPTSIEKYITAFGLPNTGHFRSNFGSFQTVLAKEKNHRLYAGNGRTDQGRTSSLTFFVQTLAFHQIPIMYSVPKFLEDLCCCISWLGFLKLYWYSRLAFFFPTWNSNHREAVRIERFANYKAAEGISARLIGDDDDDNILDEFTRFDPYDFRSLAGIPIENVHTRRSHPDWLVSGADLKESPPSINCKTTSMSIIDHGYGPVAVVSIREIDDEKNRKHHKRKWTTEELARCGVLGRIFCGIRKKIFKVVADTKCLAGGELADCPFALVMMIYGMTNSFSMNSLGSLDSWLSKLEEEIDDIAVSKHQAHVKIAKKLCKELQDYVEPNYDILEDFRNDTVDFKRTDASSLKDDIDNSTLKFDDIKGFLGVSPNTYFESLVYGNNTLEMKGIKYWKSELDKYAEKLDTMSDNVLSSLDEKRNFYSFLLTVVTIFLAPLTILTGYFGMNFNNMVELDETTYPTTPGVVLLWVIAGVSYGFFILAAVHYRIIYSAT